MKTKEQIVALIVEMINGLDKMDVNGIIRYNEILEAVKKFEVETSEKQIDRLTSQLDRLERYVDEIEIDKTKLI